MTIAFINAVLSHIKIKGEPVIKIEDVEFLDRENNSESASAKGSRFDFYAHSSDGRRFHIEVQKARENFFMKRSFYYAAQDYVSQLRQGEDYDTLEPVIFIGLVNFNLFPRRNYMEWHTLHRVINIMTGECNFRDFEIHMVELPLLRRYVKKLKLNEKPDSELNELEKLLCYLGKIGGDAFMAELVDNNPVIAKMQEYEEFFRSNPATIREYLFNKRFEQDMAKTRQLERERAEQKGHKKGKAEGLVEGEAKGFVKGEAKGLVKGKAEGLVEGEAKGLVKGLAQGREEGILDSAKKFLKKGNLSVEEIAETLGLPVETVAAL